MQLDKEKCNLSKLEIFWFWSLESLLRSVYLGPPHMWPPWEGYVEEVELPTIVLSSPQSQCSCTLSRWFYPWARNAKPLSSLQKQSFEVRRRLLAGRPQWTTWNFAKLHWARNGQALSLVVLGLLYHVMSDMQDRAAQNTESTNSWDSDIQRQTRWKVLWHG